MNSQPSAWDKVFQNAPTPLTPEEQERAFAELAQAVDAVEQMKISPEHQRVRELIAEKMAQAE